jgi:hypothetical protein
MVFKKKMARKIFERSKEEGTREIGSYVRIIFNLCSSPNLIKMVAFKWRMWHVGYPSSEILLYRNIILKQALKK